MIFQAIKGAGVLDRRRLVVRRQSVRARQRVAGIAQASGTQLEFATEFPGGGRAGFDGDGFAGQCKCLLQIAAEGGRAVGVKAVETRLGPPDESGRRRPEPVPSSEKLHAADAVIIAFGFNASPEPWFSEQGIEVIVTES